MDTTTMNATTTKPRSSQAFIDLEIARCHQKWSTISDLAKKYKKHHPHESVLDFTARMEAEYILLSQRLKRRMLANTFDSQYTGQRALGSSSTVGGSRRTDSDDEELVVDDIYHQLDDPNHVSLPLNIPASEVQLIVARLLDIIQRQIQLGEFESPDDWQAQFSKIILARIYFETGRYDKALEWLQNLALRLEDVQGGYGLVLLVQARVIKAICLESQGYDTDASESYFAALKVAEEHPQEQSKALSHWMEDCIYRSILMQLREKGPVKQTLKLMRSYLKSCIHHWPTEYRIHKRWIIFRHYIRYLTRAFQKGVYSPPEEHDGNASSAVTIGTVAFTSTTHNTAAVVEEAMSIMTQFRKLLTVFIQRHQKTNSIDLQHRILEFTYLLMLTHDTVGWTVATDAASSAGQFEDEITTGGVKIPSMAKYLRRMFQFITKAQRLIISNSNSNSLCMARHLTHLALRLGEYREAELALSTYLELLGLPKPIIGYIRYSTEVSPRNFKAVDDNNRYVTNNYERKIDEHEETEDDETDISDDEITEVIQKKLQYINCSSFASANENNASVEMIIQMLYRAGHLHLEEQQLSKSNTEVLDEIVENDNVITTKPISMKRKPVVGSYENDNEFDIARIFIQAAQQIFAQYQENFTATSILSNIAVSLLEQMPESIKKKKMSLWKSLLALGCRIGGSARSLYALKQCRNQFKRVEYLIEANLSLRKATDIDPRSWQAFYELALQQASMGQISAAINSVKRSLELRNDVLPSWHLLSLLYHTRQYSIDNSTTSTTTISMEILQAGLSMSQTRLLSPTGFNCSMQFFLMEREDGREYLKEAIAYIKAEMAKVLLVETMEGSETALSLYESIFQNYARLSKRMGHKTTMAVERTLLKANRPLAAASQQEQRSRANSTSRTTLDSSGMNMNSTISFSDSITSHRSRFEFEEEEHTEGTAGHVANYSSTVSITTFDSVPSVENGSVANANQSTTSDNRRRRQRSRSTFSQQFKEDPLISFSSLAPAPGKTRSTDQNAISQDSTAANKQNDKNVRRERRATFLGSSRPSIFRGSSNNTSQSENKQQQQQRQNSHTTSFNFNGTAHLTNTVPDNNSSIDVLHGSDYREWRELLIRLWVMVSATYTRLGNVEEAMNAIEEADRFLSEDSGYACVYHQLGQVHFLLSTSATASTENVDELVLYHQHHQQAAEDAFRKALVIDPYHVDTHIALASLYLEQGDYAFSEQLLQRVTKDLGWNRAEAWFLLGRLYEECNRSEDAKHCFLYALRLNEVSPVQHAVAEFPHFV